MHALGTHQSGHGNRYFKMMDESRIETKEKKSQRITINNNNDKMNL